MAIALPVYVADGALSCPRLPAYAVDGAFVAGNIRLPTYLLGPVHFELTPSGGIIFGGQADVVGDPMVPTGGVVFAGTSPVVQWIAVAPTGGIRWSGSPVVTVMYGEHVPTGGMLFGGDAVEESGSAVFVPAGGMLFGGSAVVKENIPFTATGGMVFGGAVTPITVYAPPVSGGMVFGGAVTPITKYAVTPSGGVVFGGTSPVTMRVSLYVPSGGMEFGGSALAYMVGSDVVTTPENPYGNAFPGWMVNIESNAASRYLGLAANSITQFNGKTYVTNASGVHEIGAEDDVGYPIKASIELPTTDFQDSHEKRMEVAYVGIKCETKMKLKLMVNDYDPMYFFIMPSSDKHKGTRIPIGKGVVGRYWGARIDNVKGADFEIESAEFKPVAQQRHGA